MADETATKPRKPRKAREPKPQPTPEQLAEQQAVKSWTSWKLDVQSAILACRRTGPSDARLLIYLLHQMNRKNCIAIVTDSKIADEVRGFGSKPPSIGRVIGSKKTGGCLLCPVAPRMPLAIRCSTITWSASEAFWIGSRKAEAPHRSAAKLPVEPEPRPCNCSMPR